MKRFYSTLLVVAVALIAPFLAAAALSDVVITVGHTTGTFYKNGGTPTTGESGCVNTWKSTATNPQLTLLVRNYDNAQLTTYKAANNLMLGNAPYMWPYSGADRCDYYFTVSDGYYVSHISMDVKSVDAPAAGKPVTCTLGTASCIVNTTAYQTLSSNFTHQEVAMFSFTGAGSNKKQQIENVQVTLSPIPTAKVTYQWIDETGAHLTAPVVEEVTVGQSYTVNQPAKTFDYYTLVSNSPIQGTTITPAFNTNTIVTTVFHDERNVLHGVKSVVRPLTNVEANKSYVLFSQHVTHTDRDAFRYVKPEDNKIYGKSVAQLTDETPYFTWTFEGTATEGQYKIKNNGADLYVTAIAHNTQGSLGTEAGLSTVVPHPNDANTLSIGNAANNSTTRWDGNPGPDYIMNAWNGSGAKITPYEYVIDPYFFVTVQIMRYAYENGTVAPVVVSTTKYPVKAGSDFALPTPPASISGEGYEDNKLKYTLGNNDLTNIQNHKLVQHYYDILNGVESIIGDSKATVIYDIYGRVYSEGDQLAPGIYIRNGKKFIVR